MRPYALYHASELGSALKLPYACTTRRPKAATLEHTGGRGTYRWRWPIDGLNFVSDGREKRPNTEKGTTKRNTRNGMAQRLQPTICRSVR